jgi:hypothetical protein
MYRIVIDSLVYWWRYMSGTKEGAMLGWHPNRDVCGQCDQELVRLGLTPGPDDWWQEMELEDMLGLPIETRGPCWVIYSTNDVPPRAALLMEDEDEPVLYEVHALYACLRGLPDNVDVETARQALATVRRTPGGPR